jgi:hypothetical protein
MGTRKMIITKQQISLAQKIAIKSDVVKAKMSAIAISRSGKIICSSSNRLLLGNNIRYSEHAEASVVRKLQRLNAFNRFKDITLFVFRISSNGISMAKPCPRCQQTLDRYPVTVFYTTENGKVEKL